jgi:hypothetical protein
MLSSWLVWGGFGVYFLAFELPPVFWNGCPWNTLSTTIWDLIQRTDGIAAIAVVAGLAVLAVHLVAPGVFERKKKT